MKNASLGKQGHILEGFSGLWVFCLSFCFFHHQCCTRAMVCLNHDIHFITKEPLLNLLLLSGWNKLFFFFLLNTFRTLPKTTDGSFCCHFTHKGIQRIDTSSWKHFILFSSALFCQISLQSWVQKIPCLSTFSSELNKITTMIPSTLISKKHYL